MKRTTLHTLAGVSTAALVVSMIGAPTTAGAHKGHGNSQASGLVTGKNVHKHLEKFQAIADANDGNRSTGTTGYEASGEYVEKQLRKAGYKPTRQYFDVETFTVDKNEVSVPGITLAPTPMSYSNSTPAGGVEAALTTSTDPLGCDAAAYSGADVAGKIVVVSRGTCSFGEKANAAGQAGAAALIIHNNTDGALNGTLGETNPVSAPVVGVTQAEGASLRDAITAGPLTGTFDLQTEVKIEKTFNVLADTPGGDPNNVVVVGAHLDSAPEGAGINDNGSGSAAILETAIQLTKKGKGPKKSSHRLGKLNNKVRFAWWGAEELGLHGSNHYVADLEANDPAELDRMAVYLNFDMVGSPNHIVGVYDANESTYPAPVPVPEGSAAAEKAFTDYFDGIKQAWVDTEFSGRSDYQAFITAGVPSTGLFSGADGTKTEEEAKLFGGTAGITYDPNYHTAKDDISNINAKALDIHSRAIGAVVRQLATSTESINGVVPPRADKPKVKPKKKGHTSSKSKKSKKGPKRGR